MVYYVSDGILPFLCYKRNLRIPVLTISPYIVPSTAMLDFLLCKIGVALGCSDGGRGRGGGEANAIEVGVSIK